VVSLGPSTSQFSSAMKYLLICRPCVTIRPRVCSSFLSSSSRSSSSPYIRVSTRVEGGEVEGGEVEGGEVEGGEVEGGEVKGGERPLIIA
jgi:hypothetical protein